MKRVGPDVAGVAAVVQRLAVLLAAGVAPASAWGYLREGELAQSVAASAAAGTPVPRAILEQLSALPSGEAMAWRGLAAAWAVAADAGAPLAPTLREFAGSLRSLAQAQRDVAVALASPAATARVVMVLPLVGVFFGMALGFNTLGTLFTTPLGFACLLAGCSLLVLASRWSGKLVRSAQPTELTPGLECELLAIAVSGGAAIDRARASVNRALDEVGLPSETPAGGVDAVLELSRRAGVPAAELLRSEAEVRRLDARALAQERAAALSVRLMLPLGLCILPAFMALGVLPLMITVVTSTVLSF